MRKKINSDEFASVQLSQLEQLLSHERWENGDLERAIEQLGALAQWAQSASLPDLQLAAETLCQLLEIALIGGNEFPDQPELAAELIAWVRAQFSELSEYLKTNREDHRAINALVELAKSTWGQYLEIAATTRSESGQLLGWETISLDTEEDAHGNGNLPSTDDTADSNNSDGSDQNSVLPDQVRLLLSALDHGKTVNDPIAEACGHPQRAGDTLTLANDASDVSYVSSGGLATANELDDTIPDDELLEAFLDDAIRGLASMEKVSLAFEESPENQETLKQFLRELHTLKGASGSVGLARLASSLHDVETALAGLQGGPIANTIELMFGAVDRVRGEVARLCGQNPAANPDKLTATEQHKVEKTSTGRFASHSGFVAAAADESLIRIRVSKFDRLMDMLAELVVLRSRRESNVTEFNEVNQELTRCASRLGQCDERLRYASADPSINFDQVLANGDSRTLSEIAKDLTVLSRGLQGLQKPLCQDNQAISEFIRSFRQELMQLRRTPLSGLFNRLQRAARDAAKAEKKKVQLKILGDDAGLEQELQERLYEPLLHIIRNAVSHGIEHESTRNKQGKPSVGTITLEAKSNPQLLVIEVVDDGQGLDYAAIRRRALERGILSPHHTPTDQELARLIFHPGFSTRDQASEVSGRGIGMDVVAAVLDQMRGRIDIDSERGCGTTMRLAIPLRSGIEHVMVFRTGGQLFALPMQAVSGAKTLGDKSPSESRLSLETLFGADAGLDTGTKEILVIRGPGNATRRNSSIRMDSASNCRSLALEVDEIIGPEEVVVRSLPPILKQHPLFSGVTLSGSSETVLLLDGIRLMEYHRHRQRRDHRESKSKREPILQRPSSMSKRALVVDDSLSARKVLVKKLKSYGVNALEAGDGMEGLEKLRHETVDIVFTDLDMPRLGGMEMLFDIQRGNYGNAPVVVVSSREEEEYRHKAKNYGAIEYLAKPITDDSLNRLLAELNLIESNYRQECKQ